MPQLGEYVTPPSLEVVEHHYAQHEKSCAAARQRQPERELICPCGSAVLIVCACGSPTFCVILKGRAVCEHAAEYLP